MASNHLLSASLFAELFQHNMVSADGRIIASVKQLQDYYAFLVQQSKDKINSLYKERKNMVGDVEKLLKKDLLTKEETKILDRILDELDLEYEDDELCIKELKEGQKKYLGPKEPKKSLFEREIDAELSRVQTLKRDLRLLDEWLDKISQFKSASLQQGEEISWKEAGQKFRERTKKRMHDMENARAKLVKQHYDEYDKQLRMLLYPKDESRRLDEYSRGKKGETSKKRGNDDVAKDETQQPGGKPEAKDQSNSPSEKNQVPEIEEG